MVLQSLNAVHGVFFKASTGNCVVDQPMVSEDISIESLQQFFQDDLQLIELHTIIIFTLGLGLGNQSVIFAEEACRKPAKHPH